MLVFITKLNGKLNTLQNNLGAFHLKVLVNDPRDKEIKEIKR